MKKITAIFFYLFILSNLIYAQGPSKGKLVILGGGDTPDYITKRIIELAGGVNSRIIIIPMAASDNEKEMAEVGEDDKRRFQKYGAIHVNYIVCNKEDADKDSVVNLLKGATGIFFSGGNQNNLTKALLGTKLLAAIKGIYKNGAVVSGMSAGAAVMGVSMITGQELITQKISMEFPMPPKETDTTETSKQIYYLKCVIQEFNERYIALINQDKSFGTIQKDNVEMTKGFDFIHNAIVDQHFLTRKRSNRLLSAILENPELLGIGVDESTAIVVENGMFEVIGESQVVVLDASKSNSISTNKKGLYKADKISQYILIAGDKFDIKRKMVIK